MPLLFFPLYQWCHPIISSPCHPLLLLPSVCRTRTWTWTNSGRCWGTGKPGGLQSMGSWTWLGNWTTTTSLPSETAEVKEREHTRCLNSNREWISGTSLVAQWLRLHMLTQGTWVWSLVQDDPTCCRVAKPVCHNYWALYTMSHNTLEPVLCKREATSMRSLGTTVKSGPCLPQWEKAHVQQ